MAMIFFYLKPDFVKNKFRFHSFLLHIGIAVYIMSLLFYIISNINLESSRRQRKSEKVFVVTQSLNTGDLIRLNNRV